MSSSFGSRVEMHVKVLYKIPSCKAWGECSKVCVTSGEVWVWGLRWWTRAVVSSHPDHWRSLVTKCELKTTFRSRRGRLEVFIHCKYHRVPLDNLIEGPEVLLSQALTALLGSPIFWTSHKILGTNVESMANYRQGDLTCPGSDIVVSVWREPLTSPGPGTGHKWGMNIHESVYKAFFCPKFSVLSICLRFRNDIL